MHLHGYMAVYIKHLTECGIWHYTEIGFVLYVQFIVYANDNSIL